MVIAEELAKKQKAISIAEFLKRTGNTGFWLRYKVLLTSVKEAVDNSLDACEESGILPIFLLNLKIHQKRI